MWIILDIALAVIWAAAVVWFAVRRNWQAVGSFVGIGILNLAFRMEQPIYRFTGYCLSLAVVYFATRTKQRGT